MKKLFLVTAISASLMACNSDDSSQSGSEPTPQGVAGTIELVDLNTNQVTVNGHRYNADSIAYNGTPLALNQLQKDMSVTIEKNGQDDTQVRLNPTIVGVVSNVDHNAKSFTINGVALTFAELSDDIDNGDWVMVSSFPAADGSYTVLSVVEFDDIDLIEQAEIEGPISNLDKNNLTFDIAGLVTVNYNLNDIEDGETLANGQWVEIEGGWNGATFNATEIDVEDYDDLGNDSEVEGVITWVANDKTSFELNSRGRFLVNNQTKFDDGNRNNLIAGQMVEVNSVKQGDNRLVTEVEFDEQDNDNWDQFEFEFDGIVSDTTRTAGIVTSFKINGQTVQADAKTVYDEFNQVNFVDGIDVEVEGVIIDGDRVAREIELND